MATSPIYSWPEPDNTDLVKNGALAIRTLGNAIDTTMGTMVAKTVVDAKGDLIAGTAADTVNRLAVGNNGETLVADSSTSTGLRYQATQAAGRNCIINGGMDIFQRTSFSTNNAYALDRWYINASTNTTITQSTAKTTPNSQFMMLLTATGTQQIFTYQAVETKNAIYYAGKTVTLSAYAAGLTTTTNLIMVLSYSTSVDNSVTGSWTDITVASGNANLTLSSTVTRWSATYNVPSDAKSLRVLFVNNAANITVGQGIYLGDVQLEVGSVATAFSRAGGTIQGELAACMRYYYRSIAGNGNPPIASATGTSTTRIDGYFTIPVRMRTNAASLEYSGMRWTDQNNNIAAGTLVMNANGVDSIGLVSSSISGVTQYRPYFLTPTSSTDYIGFNAEL